MLELFIGNKDLIILKALHSRPGIRIKRLLKSRIILILIQIYNIIFIIQVILLKLNFVSTELYIIPAPVQILFSSG